MKYILTRKIIAKDVLQPGSIIELSAERAASPMYRNRVTPYDAALEVEQEAEPSGEENESQNQDQASLEVEEQAAAKPTRRGRKQS